MHPHSLSTLIERFFCDYLRTQRNLSPHTVAAYADTFRLLLRFLADYRHRPIDQLGFDDLDADSILAFLAQLEKKRGNTARTRNARLAAIRSFARYALGQSAPDWLETAQRILAIPSKRTIKPVIGAGKKLRPSWARSTTAPRLAGVIICCSACFTKPARAFPRSCTSGRRPCRVDSSGCMARAAKNAQCPFNHV